MLRSFLHGLYVGVTGDTKRIAAMRRALGWTAAIGNDGLTDAERRHLAERYEQGPARNTHTDSERAAIAAWRASKE